MRFASAIGVEVFPEDGLFAAHFADLESAADLDVTGGLCVNYHSCLGNIGGSGGCTTFECIGNAVCYFNSCGTNDCLGNSCGTNYCNTDTCGGYHCGTNYEPVDP